MKAVKAYFLIVALMSGVFAEVQAQQGKNAQQAKADVKQNEQKVRDMVKFFEYVLNTLGSNATSARDKDVLVTESYTKIFRDAKVQVEDDLVEKRNVITNKDVQAYLKDVDFFFDDVKFEFNIKDIKGSLNANDKLFYKVSLIRNLRGTTVEGVAVNNTSPRFIEINYDPKDKDLKIVSVYTKEFDQSKALLTWWKSLSYEWQSFFKKKLNLTSDSLQLNDIQNVIGINAVDLSQNRHLMDLEPLTQLVDLQVLNLSNTSVTDLSALRNLTGLVELNLANTKVQDVSPLKYSDNMLKFNINNTAVTEISVLERMSKLEAFELRNTPVTDFTPLASAVSLKYLDLKNTKIISLSPITSLSKLTELNVSGTLVDDLTPLTSLKSISVLTLDSTGVMNLSALNGLENLSTLSVNYTRVNDLTPLKGLQKLERIYCDHTQIKRALADAFMAANAAVLVIFDSEDLRGWWDALSDPWKTVFMSATKIGNTPTNEELARIPHVDSLNISGNPAIRDVEPLRKLQKLQVLIANKTSVSDLTPLRDHRALRSLDISQTKVTSIGIVNNFTKMTVLKAEKTGISNIDALANISGMKKLYLDNTGISDSLVSEFLRKQPQCLVVFKTDTLVSWWNDLPEAWKGVFEKQSKMSPETQKEDLHKLVEMESLHVKDASVSNLSVLEVFVRLKEVDFSGTSISDVSPLINVKSLRVLHATNSPIRNLEPLRSMLLLTDVDISNTPVEELRPMRGLEDLKSFNCSGTQVSSLTSLEEMRSLEYLDCSNTSVKKIDPLDTVPLKTLKCYNTKISGKAVTTYKREHPQCTIVHY